MIGKYTSLLDWKIANLVSDEYICDYLIGLEEEAIKKVAASIDKISLGDKEAIGDLFYGLVLSGLAMQMCGNSRPASVSEHHFSDFI
jgi:glycerol-1-phosphate dehydrogenase [NAD(P)+]